MIGRTLLLLVAVFVTGLLGSVAAVMTLGMLSPAPNWPAIEAIGTLLAALVTLGAVGVALVPIFVEARRRRAVANVLRRQFLARLGLMRTLFSSEAELASGTRIDLQDDPRRDITTMERLFADSHLLNAEEVLGLDMVIMSMRGSAYAPAPLRQEAAKSALATVVHAEKVLTVALRKDGGDS